MTRGRVDIDRRSFICRSAGLAIVAAGSMLSPLPLHARLRSFERVRLFRLDDDQRFFVGDGLKRAMPGRSGEPRPLRLSLEGFHPASSDGIHALDIQAVFDDGAGERWRFFAWHYRGGDRHGSSRASGFDLGAESDCRLEFTSLDEPSVPPCIQVLDMAHATGPEPGRYVALIGRRPLPAGGLLFSGDWREPLADTGAFDYLSLRLDVRVEEADLTVRADLACMAGCPSET